MKNKQWSLAYVWNKALEKTEERIVEPRDRMWASELGRSDVDIFLKMKGEKPTNPPNDRAHRKFHAGELYEWFVFLILKKCGILIKSQESVKTTMEGCVEVSGRLDFIAGGIPDYTKGQAEMDKFIEENELPPLFHIVTKNFIEILKNEYPEGLDEKVLEVKSTATFGYEKVDKTGKPLGGHDLQNFHYSHGIQKEGALCYISRDDLRMYEIPIFPNDPRLLAMYKEKIERVSKFYKEDVMPPLEPMVLFDEDTFKFSKNFNVEYSPFLTKLYGIDRPDVYDELVSPAIGRWNRVIGRVLDGKEMTKDNLAAVEEMKARGFDAERIINEAKKKVIV